MKKVEIYTDGACSGNPGPGGWGVVLCYESIKKEISGFENNTTNNRMEMLAVIKGLSALKEKCEVNIYTDSSYVFRAFNDGWLDNWKSNNWINSNKKSVLNKDLWLELIELTQKHLVTFIKVKGHSDNELNNRCVNLAVLVAGLWTYGAPRRDPYRLALCSFGSEWERESGEIDLVVSERSRRPMHVPSSDDNSI